MSWEVDDAEFQSVLALVAPRRYEYFIKRSAGHGELWGLHGEGGWVVAEDDDGRTFFPVWPHPRFAGVCATDVWADASPQAIDIDEWVEAWLPQLSEKGFGVAVFQTPDDRGIAVAPERMQGDLDDELSKFNI